MSPQVAPKMSAQRPGDSGTAAAILEASVKTQNLPQILRPGQATSTRWGWQSPLTCKLDSRELPPDGAQGAQLPAALPVASLTSLYHSSSFTQFNSWSPFNKLGSLDCIFKVLQFHKEHNLFL